MENKQHIQQYKITFLDEVRILAETHPSPNQGTSILIAAYGIKLSFYGKLKVVLGKLGILFGRQGLKADLLHWKYVVKLEQQIKTNEAPQVASQVAP